jgi:hypothetical protein
LQQQDCSARIRLQILAAKQATGELCSAVKRLLQALHAQDCEASLTSDSPVKSPGGKGAKRRRPPFRVTRKRMHPGNKEQNVPRILRFARKKKGAPPRLLFSRRHLTERLIWGISGKKW